MMTTHSKIWEETTNDELELIMSNYTWILTNVPNDTSIYVANRSSKEIESC